MLPNRRRERERERERGRWIMDGGGVKKRPKVRWLFVINKSEGKKEKADGKNARGLHPPSLSPDLI